MRPGMHVLVEEKNGIERIDSLDGLRGVAALAVVAYHYTDGALHRLLLGRQGAVLFFILSGLVLSIVPLRVGAGAYDWPRYQLRRVIRLAIPTCAAVGLCCAVFSIFSWNAPRPEIKTCPALQGRGVKVGFWDA